jgi:PA14 domain/Aerotolerance regulator N-terminal/von Willebrand factor type A domain/CARDB
VLFLNSALLAGLVAVSIPIILHLLNRRSAKIVDWGAMRFLLDSLQARKKKIQLEEALLMACRCLLFALLALAVARPFVPPGSSVPWVVVLPCLLLGVAMAAVTTVLWQERHLRWKLFGTTALLLGLGAAAIGLEKYLNLSRFGVKGRRDIALIIDGSTSMSLKNGESTNFDLAVKEAEKIISEAGSGTSFSLILGAPVPQARVLEPIVNRNDLKEALGTLRPVTGAMAAFDSLSLAAVALSKGANPAKQIIVLTDGQNVGWEIDQGARWQALADGVANLKSQPELVIRQFPLPPTLRNAAVAGVHFSRAVIGTDRPVGITVTVTNTGTEAITPTSVDLTLSDSTALDPKTGKAEKTLTDSSLGQLMPGASETVRFPYQFRTAGAAIVRATVNVADDIAPDNVFTTVAEISGKVRVLIVDGRPSGSFFQRGSAFSAMALAPGALLKASVTLDTPKDERPARDLIDPEVKTLGQVTTMDDFSAYDVVILCDVPALAPTTARQLSQFAEAGGGVLVAPGAKAEAKFYNEWRTTAGQLVLPTRLLGQKLIPTEGEAIKPSLTTFSHRALRLVADGKQSDLGSLIFQRYWRLGEIDPGTPGASLGGRLGNGDPFLTSQKLGQGSVLLLAASLDTEGSNLASRHAFVPLLHEIVYHLTSPGGPRLNLDPAYSVNVPLTRSRGATGLRGEYFIGALAEPAFSRIDPTLHFNWENRSPAPGLPEDTFRVRWTGSLVPRYSEEYLISAEADDSVDVTIDGEQIVGPKRKRDRLNLIAGKAVPLRVEFIENTGGASVKLYWQSRSQRREIIGTQALLPYLPGQASDFETKTGSLEVTGPDQWPRPLDLIATRTGALARLSENVVPGLYTAAIPEARRAEFPGLLTPDGHLAFSITTDAQEGSITPLSPQAFLFMEKFLPVLRPKSIEDVLAILAGKQFGEELWQYLALGALALLLVELVFTRWIAIQRQSGETASVSFEDRHQPAASFTRELERMGRKA